MTASETRGYSIRVVAKRCGISAHTLRMWERRYGFPQPARTGGGARRYSDADVERLELIGAALERGYRPHEVVAEDPEVLRRLTARAPAALPSGEGPSVEGALQAVATDDRAGLAQELRRAAAVHGPRAFVSRYLAPLVRGIGEAWRAGTITVGQEHVASEAISTELRVLLRAYEGLGGRPRVLLATLPGEPHTLGLQMAALYLAVASAEPMLVGPSTPVDSLLDMATRTQADVVGLSLSSATSEETMRDVASLVAQKPDRLEIWLGGEGASRAPAGPGTIPIVAWDDLDEALRRWRRL